MPDSRRIHIKICMGSSCFARGNNRTLQVLRAYFRSRGLEDSVEICGLLCSGDCSQGPNLMIDGTTYRAVEPNAVVELLEHHLHARGIQ